MRGIERSEMAPWSSAQLSRYASRAGTSRNRERIHALRVERSKPSRSAHYPFIRPFGPPSPARGEGFPPGEFSRPSSPQNSFTRLAAGIVDLTETRRRVLHRDLAGDRARRHPLDHEVTKPFLGRRRRGRAAQLGPAQP